MKTDFFHLQIIPLKNILPHEEFDQSRAMPLVERIKHEQELVNPIIVAPFSKNIYVQLDGMNRYSAFKILGLQSILCQIVDYNDQENVELSSWSHFFPGNKEKFLEFVGKIEGVTSKKGKMDYVGHRYIKDEGPGRLCTIVVNDGSVLLINSSGILFEKIDRLNQIVSFYGKNIERDTLPFHPNLEDIKTIFEEHQGCRMMMVFPTFTRHQIMAVVSKNKLFPAGITRHIIKKRCLNVNAPLSLFGSSKPINQQNEELEKLLKRKKFRLYEEPTVYFE